MEPLAALNDILATAVKAGVYRNIYIGTVFGRPAYINIGWEAS